MGISQEALCHLYEYLWICKHGNSFPELQELIINLHETIHKNLQWLKCHITFNIPPPSPTPTPTHTPQKKRLHKAFFYKTIKVDELIISLQKSHFNEHLQSSELLLAVIWAWDERAHKYAWFWGGGGISMFPSSGEKLLLFASFFLSLHCVSLSCRLKKKRERKCWRIFPQHQKLYCIFINYSTHRHYKISTKKDMVALSQRIVI